MTQPHATLLRKTTFIHRNSGFKETFLVSDRLALDKITNQKVAIKKIVNIFDQDKEQQKRIYRELKILQHFTLYGTSAGTPHHPHIVRILNIIPPPNFDAFNDIYLVMEYMPRDFRQVTSSNKSINARTCNHFLLQILRALKYLHSAQILHRDLKPSNILINDRLDMKLCDFGLSRGVGTNETMSTKYVASRPYRSPELILCWDGAGRSLDIWSVGCILAELLMPPNQRRILFRGQTYFHHLETILSITGTPQSEDIRACQKGMEYMMQMQTRYEKRPLSSLCAENTDPDAIDLLEKMLEFNPDKRITVQQALQHPFITKYYNNPSGCKAHEDPTDECPQVFSFRAPDANLTDYKRLLFEEVLSFCKRANEDFDPSMIFLHKEEKELQA